jgi:predicted RNase H-like HicB family nuclease
MNKFMQYTVIIEQGPTSWDAYVPDLPGCIAAGDSREEAVRLIREAIEFHIEGLIEQGEPVPKPHSFSEQIEIDAA